MNPLATRTRDLGASFTEVIVALLPLIVAYFACRGLPWLIGVMAQ